MVLRITDRISNHWLEQCNHVKSITIEELTHGKTHVRIDALINIVSERVETSIQISKEPFQLRMPKVVACAILKEMNHLRALALFSPKVN
jgi:hypothetical protein